VEPGNRDAFEASFAAAQSGRIGTTGGSKRLRVEGLAGTTVLDEDIEDLREAFKAPLRW